MSMSRTLVLGILLVAFALTPPAVAGGWKTYDEGMAKSWEAIYNTGDDAAVAAFYTEDGIRMPPNHSAVQGRQAIAAYIKESREMMVTKVRLETDEVATSGDMGFARGTYVIIDSEGNEVDNGKWIQVGKRIGGEWYAYRDIWNSDNPLPE